MTYGTSRAQIDLAAHEWKMRHYLMNLGQKPKSYLSDSDAVEDATYREDMRDKLVDLCAEYPRILANSRQQED